MNITYVKGENFLSYQSLEHTFKSTSTLIQGINKTDEDQESNGTGKTGFQSLIEYCLYGNTSQKVKDKQLIRIGQKEAFLVLKIDCSIRQEILTIERTIRKSGASKLTLLINDHPQAIATVLDGNNFINKWIGISKSDLQNYYIINKERYKSFFYASNTDKIQIISRFSSANLVDKVFDKISEKVKSDTSNLYDLNLDKARAEGAIESIEEQIAIEKNKRYDDEKQKDLNKVKSDIDNNEIKIEIKEDVIKDCEERKKENHLKVDQYLAQIRNAKKEVEILNVDEFEVLLADNKAEIDQLFEKYNEINELKKKKIIDFDDLSDILAKVKNSLRGSVVCPKCEYEFAPGDPNIDVPLQKMKFKKISNVLHVVKKKVMDISERLADINEAKDYVTKQGDSYRQKRDRVFDQIRSIKDKISSFEIEIKKIESQEEIDRINSLGAKAIITQYRRNIMELEDEYEQIEKREYKKTFHSSFPQMLLDNKVAFKKAERGIEDLEDKLSKAREWSYNFKSFKSFLANQFLQVIEGLSNKYLKELRSDLQIKWGGYKIKADGSMSDRITANIIRGGEIREFSSFSGGEKARMEFALILTIRSLINNSHPYGGLDFLFTDEIFEGLDGLGLSNLMHSISEFNFPILITTHVTDSNIHRNVLTVVKEHGISKLYE